MDRNIDRLSTAYFRACTAPVLDVKRSYLSDFDRWLFCVSSIYAPILDHRTNWRFLTLKYTGKNAFLLIMYGRQNCDVTLRPTPMAKSRLFLLYARNKGGRSAVAYVYTSLLIYNVFSTENQQRELWTIAYDNRSRNVRFAKYKSSSMRSNTPL